MALLGREKSMVVDSYENPFSIASDISPERVDNSSHSDINIDNESKTPNYFNDWQSLYPELQIILDNVDVIRSELKKVRHVSFYVVLLFIRMFVILVIIGSGYLGLKIT